MDYDSHISCRIEKEDYEFMKLVYRNRERNLSDFIRRSIRRELDRISSPPGEDKEELIFGES